VYQRTQQVSHFTPERGWEADEQSAELRLRARLSLQASVIADNQIERRGADGSWQPVDETTLSAAQRGYIWRAWRGAIDGRPVIQMRGIRALDQGEAQQLFAELEPLGLDGRPLEDPALCGLSFALTLEQAPRFAERIRALGGGLIAAHPDTHAADQALADGERALGRLRQVVEAGEQRLRQAEQTGTLVDLPLVERDENEAAELAAALRHIGQRLDEQLAGAESDGKGVGELVAAAELAERGTALKAEAIELYARHRSQLLRVARLLSTDPRGDDRARRGEILRALADELAREGQISHFDGDELVVAVEGGAVRIGSRISTTTDETPTA